MDQVPINMDEMACPIILFPKQCTTLETNCDVTDNVYIHVTIMSPDTEDNNICIYSGMSSIKLIDQYDVTVMHENDVEESLPDVEHLPVVIADEQAQSGPWSDSARSPHQCSSYDVTRSREYSVSQQSHTSITVEQRNMYITKNVYNYKTAVHYSYNDEYGSKVKPPEQPNLEHYNYGDYKNGDYDGDINDVDYNDDEVACGVFMSHLPEEILIEKQHRDLEERKYVDLPSENSALKQLMSSDMQSTSRQRKTILFLGPDSQCGHTIQQIGFYDPSLGCSGGPSVDHEVVIEDSASPHQKRYQCAQCNQIFDQMSDYRAHLLGHDTGRRKYKNKKKTGLKRSPVAPYFCPECGKKLKTKEKYIQHCEGHGDPNFECSKCHKVFASKSTLAIHKKIHKRKYRCVHCPLKAFATPEETRAHASRVHSKFMCEQCDYTATRYLDLIDHEQGHLVSYRRHGSEAELGAVSVFGDVMDGVDWKVDRDEKVEEKRRGDSVINKVMSHEMFFSGERNKKRSKRECEVCLKSFDRVSDLKRHLIEHVVRRTLARAPAASSGALSLSCAVCARATFTDIAPYKAHLREHAKLTLYKCTFCNKCFSDSSNFTKHKKIHGAPYFQCDMCHRKFTSKKMLIQHMRLHSESDPLECSYCGKMFHFKSMLSKHVKCSHGSKASCRSRCALCQEYFGSMREKWDHEWLVHNVRKMIVDCLICDAKFRKYTELKRHCIDEHDVDIPTAKKLLKVKKRSGRA